MTRHLVSFTVKLLAILLVVTATSPSAWAAGPNAHDQDPQPSPTQKPADEAGWTLRFSALRVEGYKLYGLSSQDGFGLGVSGAYRFSSRLDLELSVLLSDRDEDQWFDDGWGHYHDYDESGMLTLLTGLNFHITPDRAVDFYLGPVTGVIITDDNWGDHWGLDDDDVESDFAIGINLGIDVPFGQRRQWSFNASYKVLALESRPEWWWAEELSFFSIGAGYRFGR